MKNKKSIILIVIVLIAVVLLFKKCSGDKLEGCWIMEEDNEIICIDFDKSDYIMFMCGESVKGTYSVKKNMIKLESNGEAMELKYQLKKDTLTLIGDENDYGLSKYEFKRSKEKVKTKYLTKYPWKREGTSARLEFYKDGTVEMINSGNEKRKGKYEILGSNNEMLKISVKDSVEDIEGITLISCEKNKLKIYMGDGTEPIEYEPEK